MTAVAPTHRTQEQRRAETQRKVLDATVESLLRNGYAGTTTRQVAALAGVSPGAMAHYYPRRVDLVACAIEDLAAQRLNGWSEITDSLPDAADQRLPALADRLWEEFCSPLFTIFVKLWISAADDPELYARLAATEARIARGISKLAAEAMGDLRPPAGWEGRLLLALAALRGLALLEQFEPRTEAHPDPWPMARAALIELFDRGESPDTARPRPGRR